MTIWGKNRVEALRFLMDHIGIIDNGFWDYREGTGIEPTTWWVVDHSTADKDVGYPGDMIAECGSNEEARQELVKYILHEVDRTVNQIENCTFHNSDRGYNVRVNSLRI